VKSGATLRWLTAVGVAIVCSHWAPSAHAEIFDGSGFQAISWNIPISEAERAIGGGVSRLRNRHSDYEYLRSASYQYLSCEYELLLNFEAKGGALSSIVFTHRAGAKAAGADKSCREGLSRLREKIGRPMSVSDGVQMWRLEHTTVTAMEGRGGEVQIRYTANRPISK